MSALVLSFPKWKKSMSNWCYGEKQGVTESLRMMNLQGRAGLRTRYPLTAYLHACCMGWDPFVLPQESQWGLTGKRPAFCETAWLKSSPELLACNRPTDLFSSRRQHKDAQIYHSKYYHYLVCRKPSCLTVSKTKLQINSHRSPPHVLDTSSNFPCCDFILVPNIWGLENWQI